jgi:beta-glucosidase/6-phospho-beta-glucosidase/beta-galactosidase
MIASTQHERRADDDYALLPGAGIRTARDAARWHLIDRGGGRYDFSSLAPLVSAAERHGVQVIWTLCHYGWPDGLDVFAPAFVDRFARYSAAVAGFVKDHSAGAPFYTPINEISFLAWAMGHWPINHSVGRGRDHELKHQLIRAAVAGCEAVWAVDPRARMVFGEPVIHVVPPRGRPDLAEAAARQRASQFETWDMLSGRTDSELGGRPRYLDVMGLHYYHSNQWEHPDVRLRWEDTPRDDRWVPLHRLLAEVYERYQRPLFIGETSHFGVGRARWLREIAAEACRARAAGVPLEGVCLYPILDRHDWEDANHWHDSGLWDLAPDGQGGLGRVLNEEYAAELRRAQDLLARAGCR